MSTGDLSDLIDSLSRLNCLYLAREFIPTSSEDAAALVHFIDTHVQDIAAVPLGTPPPALLPHLKAWSNVSRLVPHLQRSPLIHSSLFAVWVGRCFISMVTHQ
jgi:hypothetical protein